MAAVKCIFLLCYHVFLCLRIWRWCWWYEGLPDISCFCIPQPSLPPATLTLLYFYIWEIHIHAFPNLFIYAKFLFCRVCEDEFHRTSPCIFIGVKFALFFSFCHVWKRCQKKLSLSPAQKFNFSQLFCIFLLLFCSSFPGCPNSKLQNNFQVRAGKLLLKD